MIKKIKKTKNKVSKKVVIGFVSLVALSVGVGFYTSKTGRSVFDIKMENSETIVAKIGDKEITLGEVEKAKSAIPQLAAVPMEKIYKEFVQKYAENQAVLQNARNSGLLEDEKVQEVLKVAEDQIVMKLYLEQKTTAKMKPEVMKAIYDAEIKNFKPSEEVSASHILVQTKEEAAAIAKELKSGADFATLANAKSLDKNAKDGNLGYFTKEMMVPEFSEKAFAMKEGSISTPIQTQFGWHIVKVLDKRPTTAPTFEQLLPQIKEFYAAQLLPEVIAEDVKTVKIEVFDMK